MSDETKRATPTPEEFQRHLHEFMRQHMPGGAPPGFARPGPAPPGGPTGEVPKPELQFNLKPREVKAYLDRFVIRQEEAKKVLSVALCDHYHHVRLALAGEEVPNYAKQNVILVGPTGVGKTYLIRSIADLIGVPFVKADATKFSETGYVGGDVEDMVRELLRQRGREPGAVRHHLRGRDRQNRRRRGAQRPGRQRPRRANQPP
jgi:hypothetical protein